MTTTHKRRIAKLVAALRGQGKKKYHQGKGELCTRKGEEPRDTLEKETTYDRFCCLGVATDIYVDANRKIMSGLDIEDWEERGTLYGEECFLPNEVQEWFGLDEMDPAIGETTMDTASTMNDMGKSFRKIAGMFEKTYLKRRKK